LYIAAVELREIKAFIAHDGGIDPAAV